MEKIPKLNKCRAFFKAVGLEKNPKLINIGPTFIPDYRVGLGISVGHGKFSKMNKGRALNKHRAW